MDVADDLTSTQTQTNALDARISGRVLRSHTQELMSDVQGTRCHSWGANRMNTCR